MIFLRSLNRQLFKPYWIMCVRTLHTDRYISVREFYKDKNVLITGCTGFVGQGLVEKLLRSCPDIGRIYIPIRATKKGDTDQRYRAFINNTVFDKLRATNSSFKNKLIPLPASLEEPNLGLCENTLDTLTNEINVIYHVAALIKLNPPLREAVRSNVLASTNLFRFGKQCKHLAAYIHVSSLYTHLDLEYVEEKVYPTAWDHNQLIELINSKSDEEIKRQEPEVVGESPGTYFATKKVGEYMTKLEGGLVPVGIVRPGKVSPSLREPVPGWASGTASNIAWMSMVEKGEVRFDLADPENREGFLPADLCSNSLITTAWYLGTQPMAARHCTEPLVIHVHSSPDNDLTSTEFVTLVNQYLKENGRSKMITLDSSRVQMFMRCAVPTLIQTIRDWLDGKRPMSYVLASFVLSDKGYYTMQVSSSPHPKEYNNLMEIENALNESDRKDFSSDIAQVNWEEYIKMWLGTLKEKRENTEERNKLLAQNIGTFNTEN